LDPVAVQPWEDEIRGRGRGGRGLGAAAKVDSKDRVGQRESERRKKLENFGKP
jgi:hypothetical protein